AEQKLAEARVEAAKDLKKAAKRRGAPPTTFGEACERYFNDVAQHTKTAFSMATHLEWLKKHIGKEMSLDAIDKMVLQTIIGIRRGESRLVGGKHARPDSKKVAASTVNRTAIEPLRRVLRHVERRYNAEICSIEWEVFKLDEPRERVRSLTTNEEQKLLHGLNAIRADYQPLVRFAMLTGARQAECCTLIGSKWDFGAKRIELKGKGPKGNPVKWRKIPLTPILRELLWPLRANKNSADAVFTSIVQPKQPRADGEPGEHRPITKPGLQAMWRRCMRKCEIKDFRFHDLRHTAATRILAATGNLVLVQGLLGHEKIDTTRKYVSVSAEQIAAGIEAAAEAAALNIEEAQSEAAQPPE